MAFNPANNPGRNKIATPTTREVTSESAGSFYGDSAEMVNKSFSNTCNIDNIALYNEVRGTGEILDGYEVSAAVLRTATNFAYFLKNGADALAVMSMKNELGGKSA